MVKSLGWQFLLPLLYMSVATAYGQQAPQPEQQSAQPAQPVQKFAVRPLKLTTKTGYVLKYRLNLAADPSQNTDASQIYLSVVLSDQPNKAVYSQEFIMSRNRKADVVDGPRESPWAVSYGTISAAILATLKDAAIHQRKVTIESVMVVKNRAVRTLGAEYHIVAVTLINEE